MALNLQKLTDRLILAVQNSVTAPSAAKRCGILMVLRHIDEIEVFIRVFETLFVISTELLNVFQATPLFVEQLLNFQIWFKLESVFRF